MKATVKFKVFDLSSEVLSLLSSRERIVFFALVVLRIFVNLIDLAGISLLALSVNFVFTLPDSKTPSSQINTLLGLVPDSQGSKLPGLFTIGLVILGIFVVKAILSVVLISAATSQISKIEVKYSKKWLSQLVAVSNYFNASRQKEEIVYSVTAGTHSVFQKILFSVSTLLAELIALILMILTLAIIQPVLTIGTICYFALIGAVIQGFVSRSISKWTRIYAKAHIDSSTCVREIIDNQKVLQLSGNVNHFLNKFINLRTQSSISQVQIAVLNGIPRFFVETALIIGAFALAAGAFSMLDPVSAATILAFFLTTATRMTPAVLNVVTAVTAINSSEVDLNMVKHLLSASGQRIGD